MALDLTVSGSLQLTPVDDFNSPAQGPYPLNYELKDQKQPLTMTLDIKPTDLFGSKLVTIPTHLLAAQNFMLVKTDLPVKVRVRDNAGAPVEFERTLRQNGQIRIDGGTPSVDRLDFEGIAESSPCAKVTIIIVGG